MDEQDIQIPAEELPDFTLEDILKEFGAGNDDGRVHDAAAPELLEDLPLQELLEDAPLSEQPISQEEPDLLVWTPAPKQENPAQPVSDTIRVDTAQVRSKLGKPAVSDDTQSFTPVGQQAPQQPEPFRTNPLPEGAEPFYAGW